MGFAVNFGLNVRPKEELKNVFGAESDSDEDEKKSAAPRDLVRHQLEQQRLRAEASARAAKAAAEKVDPAAFEYDEVFEAMKVQDARHQEQKQLKQSIRGKRKYVEMLIKEAERRKLQNGAWYEKKLQRDQEAEKEAYGEGEKFVTRSYAQHLEQLKRFEEEQKKEEQEERPTAGGMKNFHLSRLGFEPPAKKEKKEEPATKEEKEKEEDDGGNHDDAEVKAEVKVEEKKVDSSVPKQPSSALDLSSAVGVKDLGAEQREAELEQLNKSRLTESKVEAARRRFLERQRRE